MGGRDVRRGVDEVYARLTIRFPDLPATDVRKAVEQARSRLATARVRHFALLLVEHAARETLNGNHGRHRHIARNPLGHPDRGGGDS